MSDAPTIDEDAAFERLKPKVHSCGINPASLSQRIAGRKEEITQTLKKRLQKDVDFHAPENIIDEGKERLETARKRQGDLSEAMHDTSLVMLLEQCGTEPRPIIDVARTCIQLLLETDKSANVDREKITSEIQIEVLNSPIAGLAFNDEQLDEAATKAFQTDEEYVTENALEEVDNARTRIINRLQEYAWKLVQK